MSGQLKEVRERIKSVISTQQITKAMKMVSAAKLRRAQQAITEIRPYSNRLEEVLGHVLTSLENDTDTIFNRKTALKKPLIILNTSNRGLCGAFNSNIIKAAFALIQDKYASNLEDGSLIFLCVGKRGFDYVKRNHSNCEIVEDWVELVKGGLSYQKVEEVAEFIFEKFKNEEIDTVEVAYGRFKNAAVQYPEAVRYLPVAQIEIDSKKKKKRRADYVFEPDKKTLLNELVPSILKTQLHRFFLDTHASEHGARMTAMDKATENADELLRELRIGYNKARQAAITTEISEIVGGAAALEGG